MLLTLSARCTSRGAKRGDGEEEGLWGEMIAEAVLSRAQNPRLPPPVALTWCQRALELYNTV